MSALAASSGSAAAAAAGASAADSNEEVQRLRLLVRKLEHQNNLLRARSLNSGLSDCGVIGFGGGSAGDHEFHEEMGRTAAAARSNGSARSDERRFSSNGVTLDDVRVLDIMDDYSLDEDDSWLYVSPSKSLVSPSVSSRNGYDADREVAWATDSHTKSPQVWLRQDLDNPSPEVRMVRRSLAYTLDEILHASVSQTSTSPMYSRGGSGMARSAADLSASGRMSPAIKPALLANTASLDAGTFIKARRNILTSAGSTPDVASADNYQMSRHDSTDDISPGFAARAASPNVHSSHVESSVASPSISNGLRSPDGYPAAINTGTFTRRRKLPAASETDLQSNLSPSSSVSRSAASTVVTSPAAPAATAAAPSILQLPGASLPTTHLSRSCDNIPAGNLTGRGIFVTAATHSSADPFGRPAPPPATRASCEALDQIQAMARMQEQSLRDEVNNSIRRNSISSGSATRSMSIGSASPAAVSTPATAAFFGPAPRESSGVPQLSSRTATAAAATVDRASNGWSNGPTISSGSHLAGGAPASNGPTSRPTLSAEVLAQQQLLQLQQQVGRGSASAGGGSSGVGTGARMAATTAAPSRQATATAVGQASPHQQASPQQRYRASALPGADVGRSSRRSLPQAPTLQSTGSTAAAPSRNSRGLSPSSREVAGLGLGSSRYVQQQQPHTPQRPQSSAASIGSSQSKTLAGSSNRYASPPRAAALKSNSHATGVRRSISTTTSSRPPSQPSMPRRSANGYF